MTDTKELAHVQEGGAIAQRSDSADMIAAIIAASKDPSVNVSAVEAMANLAMKMQDRDLSAAFNRDLNVALSKMPVITKAGIITIPAKDGKPERTQGRFARFEDIDRVVRPILMRHNLAIRFEVGNVDGTVSVRPILSHANGHTERGEAMRLPLDTSGAKNNTQGAGSAVTYGKRYTMCAMLNIVTEGTDDDGSLGKLAIDMPHERQVAVLEGADEAAAEGRYPDWYAGQSVKDRSWLVSSGNHVRLGGEVPALTGPATSPSSAGVPEDNTAEGWVAKYERDCAAARDLDTLMRVQQRGANALTKLQQQGRDDLHRHAVDAGSAARARLSGGEG